MRLQSWLLLFVLSVFPCFGKAPELDLQLHNFKFGNQGISHLELLKIAKTARVGSKLVGAGTYKHRIPPDLSLFFNEQGDVVCVYVKSGIQYKNRKLARGTHEKTLVGLLGRPDQFTKSSIVYLSTKHPFALEIQMVDRCADCFVWSRLLVHADPPQSDRTMEHAASHFIPICQQCRREVNWDAGALFDAATKFGDEYGAARQEHFVGQQPGPSSTVTRLRLLTEHR